MLLLSMERYVAFSTSSLLALPVSLALFGISTLFPRLFVRRFALKSLSSFNRVDFWIKKDDSYRYLEEVNGKKAISWVLNENSETVTELGNPTETNLYKRILSILDSKDKIPHANKIGNHYYNFWQDQDNPRGVLRRTTLEEYLKHRSAWETVLDIDLLGKEENQSWVYGGQSVFEPDEAGISPSRTMIYLSPGGSDAKVLREFDLSTKSFVEGGFCLPAEKSRISWLDENTLLVGTNVDNIMPSVAPSMTDSGYPRVVLQWDRGTPLSSASVVFEGERTDVAVTGYLSKHVGFKMEFRCRSITFYTAKYWLRLQQDQTWYTLSTLPEDVELEQFRDHLLITLVGRIIDGTVAPCNHLFRVTHRDLTGVCKTKSTRKVFSHKLYCMAFVGVIRLLGNAVGSVLAVQASQFVEKGVSSTFTQLFSPSQRTALSSITCTMNFVILSTMDDVKSRVRVWRYSAGDSGAGEWTEFGSESEAVIRGCSMSAVDADASDLVWLTTSSFTNPSSLHQIDISQGVSAISKSLESKPLKSLPQQFDGSKSVVSQGHAISADGTSVPYFLIEPVQSKRDGSTPTLLYGYGGFEISLLPSYQGVIGAAWLESGGCYVVANIRGGGEFGPYWHQSALRENRRLAYDDFIAVAEDLIAKGITSTPRLAIRGGSNGGLLMGNMFVRRPDLFGAVVCEVPLLDMRRYHKLLAGASWMAEYGDPETADWDFLRYYSPFHNIDPSGGTRYPPILVKTSTKDDRVHPYHARAFVKRLLDATTGNSESNKSVFYYENTEGGHGGAADNKQQAFMTALYVMFLKRTIVDR